MDPCLLPRVQSMQPLGSCRCRSIWPVGAVGAKLGAIRRGLVWTPVDACGIESLSFRAVWTAVDTAWRSTDQKVGGLSPSGRAAETFARQGLSPDRASSTF